MMIAVASAGGMACGCGEKGGKVKGKILLDRKPLAGAHVQFWPKENLKLGSYGATTDENGQFEITPDPRFSKLVKPGKYVVLVAKYKQPKGAKPNEAGPLPLAFGPNGAPNLLPGIYNDKYRTPLVAEVTVGDNDLPVFELSSKAGE
jgi:hypothetical protein